MPQPTYNTRLAPAGGQFKIIFSIFICVSSLADVFTVSKCPPDAKRGNVSSNYMKKILPILFILTGCQNQNIDRTKTARTLTSAIDRLLEKKTEHLDFYLNIKDSTFIQLVASSKDLKTILGDTKTLKSRDVTNLFKSKYPKLIQYDDWTKDIDTALTEMDLKINILANQLSFLNRTLDLTERVNEYSFKDIKTLTTDKDNICEVYLTTKLRPPLIQFLFGYAINDSLKFSGGITDTTRIVARESGDHFTIVNKDKKNYHYVLKFAKADGSFKYFTLK